MPCLLNIPTFHTDFLTAHTKISLICNFLIYTGVQQEVGVLDANEAFCEAYAKYHKYFLYLSYSKLDNFALAEECMQETFISLYRKLKKIEDVENKERSKKEFGENKKNQISVFAYLLKTNQRIVARTAVLESKAHEIGKYIELFENEMKVEDNYDFYELNERLRVALRQLRIEDAVAVFSFYGHEKNIREIAEHLAESPSTVRRNIKRTLLELRELLEDNNFE